MAEQWSSSNMPIVVRDIVVRHFGATVMTLPLRRWDDPVLGTLRRRTLQC